jgi:hypothetical protein
LKEKHCGDGRRLHLRLTVNMERHVFFGASGESGCSTAAGSSAW